MEDEFKEHVLEAFESTALMLMELMTQIQAIQGEHQRTKESLWALQARVKVLELRTNYGRG